MQQLETVVIETYQPSFERQSPYHAQDLGSLSSVALYSGPIGRIGSGPLFGSEHFGRLSGSGPVRSGSGPIRPVASRPIERVSQIDPFLYGFALGSDLKLTLHGPDETTLSYGHVKKQSTDEIIKEYNGYECSILDTILKNNFKRFP